MGNICCKYSEPEGQPEKSPILTRISYDHPAHLDTSSGLRTLEPSEIATIKNLGDEKINEYLSEAKKAIECDRVRDPKYKLVDTSFKVFNNKYCFYADFPDLPSGNKLHEYSHELEYPFTPAMFFMYSFQQNLEAFNKVDDSLEIMEVLNFSCNNDIAVLITRNKTKKILVIEPRSFIVIRIIQKVSNYEFWEVQKSLQLTSLAEEECFVKMLASQQNLAEIRLGAVSVIEKDGKTIMRTFNQIDILSSTGPTILKLALKGKFTRFYQNTIKETLKFVLNSDSSKFADFLWFTNDVQEINHIFEENKQRVGKAQIVLNELDKLDRENVSDKLSEVSRQSEKFASQTQDQQTDGLDFQSGISIQSENLGVQNNDNLVLTDKEVQSQIVGDQNNEELLETKIKRANSEPVGELMNIDANNLHEDKIEKEHLLNRFERIDELNKEFKHDISETEKNIANKNEQTNPENQEKIIENKNGETNPKNDKKNIEYKNGEQVEGRQANKDENQN